VHLLLARPDNEALLAAEVGAELAGARLRTAGPEEVRVDLPTPPERSPDLAFALQVLPDAEPLGAGSVSEWARRVGERVIERLEGEEGPWRFHGLGADTARNGRTPRRLALIEGGVREVLRKRQRRLLKTWRAPDQPFLTGELLVQLRLATPEAGDLSVASSAGPWARALSPWPGGYTEIPRDVRPPSRAYRKLLEVERRWGRCVEGGQACVDLGAAPGGWTFVAVERGARVTAVDRSPLCDDLMASPRVTYVRGDAFRFRPEAPVDWLLADVIAFPDRPLALLEAWLEGGWCRRFAVTFKFRGRPELEVVQALKALLRAGTRDFGVRQLQENKNEVTAWGEV